MDLQAVLNNIGFVDRYKKICSEHNDLENAMRGNNKKLYESLLTRIGYEYQYYSNGSFFKISMNDINLHLMLKDGLVEPLLYVMREEGSLHPRGRFDGIAEQLQEGFREKFTIPKYTSESELEVILRELFSIYEDIKSALQN